MTHHVYVSAEMIKGRALEKGERCEGNSLGKRDHSGESLAMREHGHMVKARVVIEATGMLVFGGQQSARRRTSRSCWDDPWSSRRGKT